MTSRTGFTLAEVVVVLLILGISAAVVGPAIARGPASELDTAADALVQALERARRTAVTGGATVRVALEPTTRRLTVVSIRSDSIELVDEIVLQLPAGVTLDPSSSPAAFTFTAAGLATGDSVRVGSPDGRRTIRVDRWTGVALRDGHDR